MAHAPVALETAPLLEQMHEEIMINEGAMALG